MSLQNRVKPDGKIIISASRGMLMGNRGVIHKNKVIVAKFKTKAWITCSINYKGIKRVVMTDNLYTELFFLDEATAFSAGHRPCSLCRNKNFKLFKSLWIEANAQTFDLTDFSIGSIDRVLHDERISIDGKKLTYSSKLSALPNGVIIQMAGSDDFYLYYNQQLLKWSESGYTAITKPNDDLEVNVLTPQSMVKIFGLGYLCEIHDSAKKLLCS